MKLSFKKRIAVINTMAVAFITAVVFIVIYGVVSYSSYRHLDSDILLEKEEILNSLDWKADSIIVNKMPEWEEAEHKKIEVNPTFIQVVDNKDRMIFRSANLRYNHFLFNPSNANENFYNTKIEGQRIRIGQFPVINDEKKIIGQLTVGISQQESFNVLSNLLFTLCISYPLSLLVLFIVIYMAASKAIAPVQQLIRTTAGITDSTIHTRLTLPENQDEIYKLAKTINELLTRIEISIQQQKQFTADASHEIRTPLAAIKGTLEVLLRKKREPDQYEEKIVEVISQADRLNHLLDQLLQMARLDSDSVSITKITTSLNKLIEDSFEKNKKNWISKNIQLHNDVAVDCKVQANPLYLEIILDNLLENAIKYGNDQGNISFSWNANENILTIKDDGPGISSEQIPFLFDRFYRADDSRSSNIPGSGLGLSIVKKLASLQDINISVISNIGAGTSFLLKFPS